MKRLLSILLCYVMLLGLIPTAVFAEGEGSTGTVKAIQLGTGSIRGYDAATKSYDYIHFGNWTAPDEYTTTGPIKWRVLDTKTNMEDATEGDGLFLLSEGLYGVGSYGFVHFTEVYRKENLNVWQGSDAQNWCRVFAGETTDTNVKASNAFTQGERSAILETRKSDPSSSFSIYHYSATKDILNGDKVFFLSVEEATNPRYGFYTMDDSTRVSYFGTKAWYWWLRSPRVEKDGSKTDTAGLVRDSGYIDFGGQNRIAAVRPACNLNPETILFTSAAAGGKSADIGLAAVPAYTGSEWKLTLKDSSRSFTADVTPDTKVAQESGYSDWTVNIDYSGAKTGENEYVSAMLCDDSGNVLYYGNIARNSASGTASVTIPDNLARGSYTLKVFSEQCNGDYQTDYASAFRNISLTVDSETLLIYTADDLKVFRDEVNGGNATINIKLMDDIVLNDGTFDANGKYTKGTSGKVAEAWEPIGSSSSNPYKGTFDGNAHTINGLYVKDGGSVGLFGSVQNGTVKNVTVTGHVEGTGSVGGIAGCIDNSSIENCVNLCRVASAMNYETVGGIVGFGDAGEILSCANLGTVSVSEDYNLSTHIGGIIGKASGTTVTDCYNAGKVMSLGNSSTESIGGIVGTVGGTAIITNCYNVGKVSIKSVSPYCHIGNVAGYKSDEGTINKCYSLSGMANSSVGKNDGETQPDVAIKTKAEFADGTVLKGLRNNRTDSPWTKTGYVAAADMVLPLFSWQTEDVRKYNISVVDKDGNAVQITSLNQNDVLGDGTVRFAYDDENEKGTLTLNGAELSSEDNSPISASKMENLEIVLKGKNKIQAEEACIIAKNLTFSGEGSLDITNNFFYAVDCTGAVTVNGGSIRIDSLYSALCFDGAFTVNGGTVELIGAADTAIVPAFTGLVIILADDRIMIAGRFYDGSDAQVTATSEAETISEAKYIKILNKYVPIVYDPGQYGTGVVTTRNKTYGEDFGLADALYTRAGYKQTAWTTAENGGEILRLGSAYSGNEPLRLYPVWVMEEYGIRYDLGGGIVAGNPDGYTVESDSFTLKNPVRDGGYKFAGWSGTGLTGTDNQTVTIAKGSTGDRSYKAHWVDILSPDISGLENGKIYCSAVEFTVTDNDGVESVTVNGTPIRASNGKYTLSPAKDEQKVVAKDSANNATEITVTVNDGHTYEWQIENGQYWQKCKFCSDETEKKDIPTIDIIGADKVCRTQDYKFSFTLPEGATNAEAGYGFTLMGGPITLTAEDSLYSGIIQTEWYDKNETNFVLTVYAQTADGFIFSAEKTVAIQNEHTGGTATCKDAAVCKVCGESYGELDSNNHADIRHIEAKAATKTAEGNIEYWYCSGCSKFFADKDGIEKITKADTVTAKLPDDSKSPQTGDNPNLALLLVSCGAVTITTIVGRKKKRRVK